MKTTPSWLPSAILYQVNLRSLGAREPRNAVEAATERPLAESPLAYLTKHLPHQTTGPNDVDSCKKRGLTDQPN